MSEKKKFTLILKSKQKEKEENNYSDSNDQKILNTSSIDLRQKLSMQLTDNIYECMICYDKVKAKDRIWSCGCCWACFHIKCISDWSTSSIKGLQDSNYGWRCPGCQNLSLEIPKTYSCFCGKIKEPKVQKNITPHSCGLLCMRKKSCDHKCVENCHPGPCADCNLIAPFPCACGKTVLKLPCSELKDSNFNSFCGNACQKVLNCGIHQCRKGCHSGGCPPCGNTRLISCNCGEHSKEIVCGSDQTSFTCDKECKIFYECKIHTCTEICHQHVKSVCPFDPQIMNTCFCGANNIERKFCSDPIPSCGGICRKVFECGHSCSKKCHSGPCPPCCETVLVDCKCKKSKLELPCIKSNIEEELICKRICQVKFNCKGRHICNDRCCTKKKEEHRECNRLCGRKLSCKLHNCLMACSHQGRCHDCVEGVSFNELSCGCGRSILYPPIACNTPVPLCNYPCSRPRLCSHVNISPHYCHPLDSDCPPCVVFTSRMCACGKEMMKNIPCSRQSLPSCGKLCQKKIADCGHLCQRVCHSDGCTDSHPCLSQCLRIRSCGHECQSKCHGKNVCSEDDMCKHNEIISCSCGRNVKSVLCCATKSQPSLIQQANIACDEICAKELKKDLMAKAFEIDPNGTSSLRQSFTGWPENIVKTASSFMTIVLHTEKILSELVVNSDVSYYYFQKQRLSKANFIINGLVEGYGFLAECVDQNVGKGTVIARRIPGKNPSVPPRLLSDVVKTYNPLDPFKDAGIQKPVEPLELSPSWKPNGIFINGISETASNDSISKILLPHLQKKRNPSLFWLKDSQCFVVWEKDDEEVESNIDIKMLKAGLDDQNIGEDVKCCLVVVTALGGLINEEREILARAKDRNLYLRESVQDTTEWKEAKKANWKKYLIHLI